MGIKGIDGLLVLIINFRTYFFAKTVD